MKIEMLVENLDETMLWKDRPRKTEKGGETSRRCLWTNEKENIKITYDFFSCRYKSRETNMRRETSRFALFWISFLKENELSDVTKDMNQEKRI